MTNLLLILATLAGLPHHPAPPDACWKDVGLKAEYGSADQLRDLQQFARSGRSCDFYAITWRIRPMPDRRSVLIWDLNRQQLVRIHIESHRPRWERWTGATRRAVLADDPGDGYDYASYTSGSGSAGVSSGARSFVRSGAGSRFDAGL